MVIHHHNLSWIHIVMVVSPLGIPSNISSCPKSPIQQYSSIYYQKVSGWYRHDLLRHLFFDEEYWIWFSQWPFEGVCSAPCAMPDQMQLTWSTFLSSPRSCPRWVQWWKGLGSLLAMAFDRCCAAGGEHWWFAHSEHWPCHLEKHNVDPLA